ncbi:MAG: DUF1697 domain-containing protein [Levilactobacillus sp.]|jgi:uncharacterized protein (DUF1697 family)|uniref:DUF1697 domain-containing protein n=1 Tax=Levilactobacillus sp. TaxID=2767919 RepID=UPI002583975B|nr:DUF1697 domain-containing protein [Levilactobacillus sp.]MCI1553178.1 DUF1697 domain-containing protein [Levilactobacillus sp.]MCI1599614.1 DUF1697 domain-containing protein [Levilactobacillus sp.]MCI1605125.1 DUF1697 domain-containing protein [Levilactobacillus sp.]
MDNLLILRAINTGTTHRIPMADLHDWLQAAGFARVQTVGNTGNGVFTSDTPLTADTDRVANLLATHVDFDQPFGLMAGPDFLHELAQAPDWWTDAAPGQHMLLFKLTTYALDQDTWLTHQLTANDRVAITPHLIFWTVTAPDFRHSGYGRLTGTPFYHQTSTRSYRTAQRLQRLLVQRGQSTCYTK